MANRSQGALLLGTRQLEIREFDIPAIGPDEGLLRVEATGVCGTDWGAYAGKVRIYDLPCILGHEVVGRIERLGPEAAKRWGLQVGDRVALEEYLPCGRCTACLAGRYQKCRTTRYGGKSIHDAPALWGGYATYMYLHPNALLHKVSSSVPAELAQLFVPISNGLYWAQESGGARVGSTVVIIGPGPHGLGTVVGAKEAGAGCIIVIGLSRDKHRLEVARALGAHHTFCIDTEDVVARTHAVTDGHLADTVVNVATSPRALELALNLAADFGTVVHAGLTDQTCQDFQADQVIYKGLTIKGVLGRPNHSVPPALRLIESGRYPLEQLCTHRFSVAETEWALQTAGGEGAPGAIRVSVVNEPA